MEPKLGQRWLFIGNPKYVWIGEICAIIDGEVYMNKIFPYRFDNSLSSMKKYPNHWKLLEGQDKI